MLRKDDSIALAALIGLWLLFFWRLFTPVQSDQATLVNGDFSGQFVAFAAYQYDRWAVGEVPLWNPYNNGGFPFIGDTQAAVFYPPRLATIALSHLSGGWRYHALELEMTFHVLAYSLLMYALVRRLTSGHPGSVFGAFIAAVTASYGGFMTSYPPLQLAILEAAVWLPLAVLGVLEATRADHLRWRWLLLAGFALGLSWMAGHPQTSWFLTFLLLAYFAFRTAEKRANWRMFVLGTTVFGGVAVGVVAVQLLPGLEYLAHTARTGLGFEAKGNGFLFQDLSQFVFPGILGPWSPLYTGIAGLALALIAIWRKTAHSLFWTGAALLALVLSMGVNSPLFHLFYNVLPGMRYFRGQERAAFIVANSLAILAGLGAAHLITWDKLRDFKASRQIQRALLVLTVICALFAGAVMLSRLDTPQGYTQIVSRIVFSVLAAGGAFLLLPALLQNPASSGRMLAVALLVTFELFTFNMDNSSYDNRPPEEQLAFTPPPLVAAVLQDQDMPFRVDGYRGVHDNYASLYQILDMRGISPLFLDGPFNLIEPDKINPLAWELFAVRYVYSDWHALPVASAVIASGEDRYGPVNLHHLDDPRPFALVVYKTALVDSDSFARALLADPRFDPRQTVILQQRPEITLPETAPDSPDSAVVTRFTPEHFVIQTDTTENGILSLAHPDYPGWTALIDSKPTPILRAYGALAAIELPKGKHTIDWVFDPASYRLGALLSGLTWSGLLALCAGWLIRRIFAYIR